MKFSPADADTQAIRLIELLIESEHYKGFRKENVIRTIAKDANALASAITEKPEEAPTAETAPEPSLNRYP